MRITLLCLCLIGTLGTSVPDKANQKVPPFSPKAYPKEKFRITQQNYVLGETQIKVIEVKNLGFRVEPYACRAWFQVRRGGTLIGQRYYADTEPVGFSYGIFIPRQQPWADFFVAVKEGDYDGRLLLVDKDGKLNDFPGGFYFLSKDRRFLIGIQASDDQPLVVVDVEQRRLLIDGRKDRNPGILDWYQENSSYFYTSDDPQAAQSVSQGKRVPVYRVDLAHGRVVRALLSAKALALAHKIEYDFDPRKKEDCTARAQ